MQMTGATVQRPCGKCDGHGYIRAYSHIHGGRCFTCAGTGIIEAPADWQAREARNARRRKAQAAKRAGAGQNAALWAEFAAVHPVEAARIWELRAHPRYGYAYSAVATYRREDSNPADALHIIADAL